MQIRTSNSCKNWISCLSGNRIIIYNTSRPHATGGITQVEPGYSPPAHEISFTPFNKIKDIEAYNEALGHTYRQDFTYGPERSRKLVETYREGVHIRSRVYAGGIYEKVTDHESDSTTRYHYISGGDGLAAILVSRPGGDSLYYVHKDHLGSILALTNQAGTVVERYSFDAWGRRRNPTDWSQKASGIGYITNRGFTGHEHMDLFGLISMSNEVRSRLSFPAGNGRIYDPALGRFLSPDPYVQIPQNAQNFNRYSYALNNPLIYTDPSGKFIFTALAAIFAQPLLPIAISADIGMYVGGKAANDGEWNPLNWAWQDAGTWAGMGIGAVVGGLTGYAGSTAGLNLVSSMGYTGFSMTSGMIGGTVYSGIASGWDPASMLTGAVTGGVLGAATGLTMTGLGAAWDGISFGHTGTIGDAVRKGLGGLPGLTYRDWSMSQVIWTGFNLPSTGTMLANTSMLVNGALHGQWGSKLVPVGRVTNTTAFMGMGVTDAATWYNLSGGTQLNMNVTARTINSFYKNMGWNTNHIKVLSLSGVSGNYNAHGTFSRFRLAGQGPVTTSGKGSFPWTNVNGAYPLSIATLQGPQSPDIPALRMTHRVRLYERYGEGSVPWWRRVFFGF